MPTTMYRVPNCARTMYRLPICATELTKWKEHVQFPTPGRALMRWGAGFRFKREWRKPYASSMHTTTSDLDVGLNVLLWERRQCTKTGLSNWLVCRPVSYKSSKHGTCAIMKEITERTKSMIP